MKWDLPVQPQRSTPVDTLMLYLTEECNLRCTYCFVQKQPRHMSAATARNSLEYFLRPTVSGANDSLQLNYFGGEPFLRLDLMEELWSHWQVLQPEHPHKQILFASNTNGTIATPRAEKVIKKSQLALMVSLDGPAVSNSARPYVSGKPSYGAVLRNLPRLQAWAPFLAVRLTYHPDSLDLVGSLQHILDQGVQDVVIGPVVETDWRGKEEAVEQAFCKLTDWILSELAHQRVAPLSSFWNSLRTWHQTRADEQRPERCCPVGRTLLAVDTDGNVLPCHRFLGRSRYHLGTVSTSPSELGQLRQPFEHLTSRQIDADCHKCNAKAICGGGCRAVALQSGGGLHGVHPNHCLLQRAYARALERVYASVRQLPEFLTWAAPTPLISPALTEQTF